MQRERNPADIWADLKSADVLETQARQPSKVLCHVEHVHGNVINLTLSGATRLSSLLDELGGIKTKEPACGA